MSNNNTPIPQAATCPATAGACRRYCSIGECQAVGAAAVPAPPRPTDDALREWIERHDLGSMSLTEARGIFEDAQSWHLTLPPASTSAAQLTDAHILAGLRAARQRACDFDYDDGTTAAQREAAQAAAFREGAGLTSAPAEPTDENDLDPRVALAYARQMKDYCEAFSDRDWSSIALFGSVDEKNLAGALDNLTECAAMLMNMADRVKRAGAPDAANAGARNVLAELIQAIDDEPPEEATRRVEWVRRYRSTLAAARELLATPTGVAASPCPQGDQKPEPSCTNRHQCWEPCGELGKSAEHARVSGVAADTPDHVAGVSKMIPAADESTRAPDGTKLAPLEPTREMLDAGVMSAHGNEAALYRHEVASIYRAMLDAAHPSGERTSAPAPEGENHG